MGSRGARCSQVAVLGGVKPSAPSLQPCCLCLFQVLSFLPVSWCESSGMVDSLSPWSTLLVCMGRILSLPQSFYLHVSHTCPLHPSFLHIALDIVISHLDLESNWMVTFHYFCCCFCFSMMHAQERTQILRVELKDNLGRNLPPFWEHCIIGTWKALPATESLSRNLNQRLFCGLLNFIYVEYMDFQGLMLAFH